MVVLRGPVLVSVLLLSSVFVAFYEQVPMLAAAVTRTTTQTATMTFTVSGVETSTMYQTLSYVSEIPTLSWTTYTTIGWVDMPVWVTAIRTALVTHIITSVVHITVTLRSPTCTTFITRVGPVTIRLSTCYTYTRTVVVNAPHITAVVSPEVVLTQVVSYVPVQVQGTVVTNYPANFLTTVYSVYAMTTTFTEGGPVTVTRTDVLTYEVDDESSPTLRLIMDNLLLIVALVAAAIAAVSLMMLRKARVHRPESAKIVDTKLKSTSAFGFCVNCGTAFPEGAEFCPKCGQRKISQ